MNDLALYLKQHRALLFLGPDAEKMDTWQAVHRTLALCPFQIVISVRRMQQAIAVWQRAGREVYDVPLEIDPPAEHDHRVLWLTLPQQGQFATPWLERTLHRWFSGHAAVFIGQALDDPAFLERYLKQIKSDLAPPRILLTHSPLDSVEQLSWELRGLRVVAHDPLTWACALQDDWQQSQLLLSKTPRVQDTSGEPYKFLDAFAAGDESLFFGRDRDIANLGDLVISERLVICFGESGVGKTSLLQAGLLPRLQNDQNYLPLYCRPGSDPIAAIRAQALVCGELEDIQDESLAMLLMRLVHRSHKQAAIIILDQFEEVFTQADSRTIRAFAEALAECLRPINAPFHVVLSIREDFFARLHELSSSLPHIFVYRYQLAPFNKTQALMAITEPAKRYGYTYEDGLPEQIVADMSRNNAVAPVELQIVCTTLYQDLRARGLFQFTLEHYRELGGTTHIMHGFLNHIVEALPESDKVRMLLKALVTAQGTRLVLQLDDLTNATNLEEHEIRSILDSLEKPHRLANKRTYAGRTYYELTHDVLCESILAWVTDPAEQEARTIHDLLRIEHTSASSTRALLSIGKMRAIHEQQNNPYLHMSPDDLKLIARSALYYDIEPRLWLDRAAKLHVQTDEILLPAIETGQEALCLRAARLLRPEAARSALVKRLQHADGGMRAIGIATLGLLDDLSVWPVLRRARYDKDPQVREAARDAMERLDQRAEHRLRRWEQVQPLLIAGSAIYWLFIALFADRLAVSGSTSWIVAFVVWSASLLTLGATATFCPRLIVAWSLLIGCGIALCGAWGYAIGLALFLLVGQALTSRPYVVTVAFLPFLPLIQIPTASATVVYGIAAATGLGLALLGLTDTRWGRYREDRLVARAVVAFTVFVTASALLAEIRLEHIVFFVLLGTTMISGGMLFRARFDVIESWGEYALGLIGFGPSTRGCLALPFLPMIIIEIFLFHLPRMLLRFIMRFTALPLWLGQWFGQLMGASLTWLAFALAADFSPYVAPAWSFASTVGIVSVLATADAATGERRFLWRMITLVLSGVLSGALFQGLAGALMGGCLGIGLGLNPSISHQISEASNQRQASTQTA